MPKLGVFLVDDSSVIRRLLSNLLSEDPMLEVVGTAANGRIALTKIPHVNPDVVILDVEMPELNGLETLAEIRKTLPSLPVIMFSSLTQRGAEATLDALSLGASDYVAKPEASDSSTHTTERIKEQLIPKIKIFGLRHQTLNSKNDSSTIEAREIDFSLSKPQENLPPAEVVAIGVSTGGPNALAVLLSQLPSNFSTPIVIVQHMPPMFTRILAERLSQKSPIPIREGVSEAVVRGGEAWIAPGDYHMRLEKSGALVTLEIEKGPLENSCRPSVDVLFRSVADIYGARVLGVILTGMGEDGFKGCQRIREMGGQILAQDQASSVVWGMPGTVVRAGLAHMVLPLEQLSGEIVRRTSYTRIIP